MAITRLLTIGEDKTHGDPHYHLKNSIYYICDPKKTEGGIFIGGNSGITPESVYYSFEFNKRFWEKEDQRQGYHYILSFSPDDQVDEKLALKIADEFAAEILEDKYFYVTAVHNDKKHMHVHLVFDSVSYVDGYKYHTPKGDWERRIQPVMDKICAKHMLSTLVYDKFGDRKGKNYKEWKAEQQKSRRENQEPYSAYDIIRDDIDDAIRNSDSYTDFIEALKKQHYEITRDQKYLSVRPHFRQKAVRTGRLGSGYDKESIQLRIMAEKSKDTIFSHYKHYGDMKEVNSVLYFKVRRNKGWKMSAFQKSYYRRLYRLFHIRRPFYYDQSWRYKKDVLQVKKISRCTMLMLKEDIRSQEDVETKINELQHTLDMAMAQSKALKSQLYQGDLNKLVREYQKKDFVDDDPDKQVTMQEIRQKIEKLSSLEDALQKLGNIQEEIRNTGNAIRDMKKKLKDYSEIQDLLLEPEHLEEVVISEKAKQEIRKKYTGKHNKQEKGAKKTWQEKTSSSGKQKI